MAAAELAKPGTEFGPCLSGCIHEACAEDRILAQTKCTDCAEDIGYGRPFFQCDNWKTLTHAVCAAGRKA